MRLSGAFEPRVYLRVYGVCTVVYTGYVRGVYGMCTVVYTRVGREACTRVYLRVCNREYQPGYTTGCITGSLPPGIPQGV